MDKAFLVTTTENVGDYDYQIVGPVFGIIVMSRNALADAGANLKSKFGGELKCYTKLGYRSRQEAIKRMVINAQSMSADAVVMMRFDSNLDENGNESVVAYGTAVKMQ